MPKSSRVRVVASSQQESFDFYADDDIFRVTPMISIRVEFDTAGGAAALKQLESAMADVHQQITDHMELVNPPS